MTPADEEDVADKVERRHGAWEHDRVLESGSIGLSSLGPQRRAESGVEPIGVVDQGAPGFRLVD